MGRERRQFPRIHEPCTVRYRRSGEIASAWSRVTVINLSAGGLRFRCADEPLEPGAPLQIQVALPGFREPMTLKALVVWNQLHASGVTEVGAEFQDLDVKQQLTIDRLVSFLKRAV